LPPALSALLDIDRRVTIEEVRDPIAQDVIGANRHQSPTAANYFGIDVRMLARK
jgi:hypothetical protein